MKFGEKIGKLLIFNEKKLHSIGELERYLGLGLHTIRTAIKNEKKKGTEPTTSLQVKIIEGLGINREWWETGKGEIFEKKPTSVSESGVAAYLNDNYRDELIAQQRKHLDDKERIFRLQETAIEQLNLRIEQLERDLAACRPNPAKK